ncbi:hypothetical protein MKZ38_009481 [Zalerion maritima]|uniref:Integral membrane protein n=1 Tax=Zalerion maritima TaxID=339359 RepID=A0AAD5RGT0_9PEZI|nr:hypothetical protein MKZ38_009481 [Zalerion maritima]
MAPRRDTKGRHFVGHHYHSLASAGPFSFFNPTVGYLSANITQKSRPEGAKGGRILEDKPQPDKGGDVFHIWRSRDNRKGRHSLAVGPQSAADDSYETPEATNSLAATWRGIQKMFLRYPIWDVSYDVAVVFTLGSVIWVINGFFIYLPLAAPSTEFKDESSWGGGLTALIGATVFEFGSVLLMLEAMNENRTDCFGWAVEAVFEDGISSLHITPTHQECAHSHPRRNSFLQGSLGQQFADKMATTTSSSLRLRGPGEDAESPSTESPPETSGKPPGHNDAGKKQRQWEWFPSWHELQTHYFREIGFLACFSQLVGATIFWIAGISGIPPILNRLEESRAAENCVYWLPQVIGGTGFIVSSFLFMVEVQEKWWKPAPRLLGWHVGFWNLVGAIGFTLCGALGFGTNGENGEAVEYALIMSTFVGSWAFLMMLGGDIQKAVMGTKKLKRDHILCRWLLAWPNTASYIVRGYILRKDQTHASLSYPNTPQNA